MDNVGVVVGNAHHCGVALPAQCDLNVEDQLAVQEVNPDGVLLQISPHVLLLLRRHLGDDLQQQLRPASHHARRSSSLDAVETAGVRHHHALHVLDDVAAGLH